MENNPIPEKNDGFKAKIKDVTAKVSEYGLYPKTASALLKFPYFIIVVIIYLGLSFAFGIWHPLWIIFLTIPIYYRIAAACKAKTKKAFMGLIPIPEIIVSFYLILSFALGNWKFTWILLLIIPLYYWYVGVFVKNE